MTYKKKWFATIHELILWETEDIHTAGVVKGANAKEMRVAFLSRRMREEAEAKDGAEFYLQPDFTKHVDIKVSYSRFTDALHWPKGGALVDIEKEILTGAGKSIRYTARLSDVKA